MQKREPKQDGNDWHVNGAPFFESFQGDAVPVALPFDIFIPVVVDTVLLFFHVHLFPQFSYEILPDMPAGRYRHHAQRCHPRQQRIEMYSRMNENHQCPYPSRIAVKSEKKSDRAILHNFFLSGRIAEGRGQKYGSGDAQIPPYPGEPDRMEDVVKRYCRRNQQQV